jgi:MFS family permease
MLLMLIGTLLVSTGSSFASLAVGRFIAGIGSTVIVIVAAQALSQGFLNNRKFSLAMGIFNMGVPLGTIFAHNVFSRYVSLWGWRTPMIFSAFCCLIMMIIFWRYKGFVIVTADGKEEKRRLSVRNFLFPESLRCSNSYLGIWLAGLSFMIFMAAKTGAITFAPGYFFSLGHSYAYAGFLASLLMMGSLVTAPVIGQLIGKTGKEEKYVLVGNLALTVLFILLYSSATGHLFLAALIGLAVGFVPVSVFSLVPRLVQAERIGLGYGIIRICENAGVLWGPFAIGLAYDLSGSTLIYGALVSVLCLIAAAIALTLGSYRKRADKERKFGHTL